MGISSHVRLTYVNLYIELLWVIPSLSDSHILNFIYSYYGYFLPCKTLICQTVYRAIMGISSHVRLSYFKLYIELLWVFPPMSDSHMSNFI